MKKQIKVSKTTKKLQYSVNEVSCREEIRWGCEGDVFSTIITVDGVGCYVIVSIDQTLDEAEKPIKKEDGNGADSYHYLGTIKNSPDNAILIGQQVQIPVECIIFAYWP